jgi:PBSX family phage terminase large subunit
MNQARTVDLSLYDQQCDFVDAAEHHVTLCGGIGSGKTIAGAARALLASLGYVGTKTIPTPNLGEITAPTYPMLRDATIRTFRDTAGDLIAEYHKAENTFVMRNGSEVICRSADDPEHLRGPTLAWYFGDEAALYSSLVQKIMLGRLRQFGKQGYEWYTTTPKGRNWIYQEFVQKQRTDYRIIKVRTRDNPFLAEEYIASLEEAYTGDFARQELLGDFVSFEGLVYPEFSEDSHVTGDIPAVFKRVIAGVDWGFVHPGVINVYGITADERMFLVHEEHARQRGIDTWADVALQLRNIWHIEQFYADPSEPDYIRKFNEKGCKAVGANNTVSTGIQAVKRRLSVGPDRRPRLMYYRGAVQNIAEKGQYQWAKRGETLLDEPMKANDHCCDAERYAVMAVDGAYQPLETKVSRWI